MVYGEQDMSAPSPILTMQQEMRAQQGRKVNLAKVGWQQA